PGQARSPGAEVWLSLIWFCLLNSLESREIPRKLSQGEAIRTHARGEGQESDLSNSGGRIMIPKLVRVRVCRESINSSRRFGLVPSSWTLTRENCESME